MHGIITPIYIKGRLTKIDCFENNHNVRMDLNLEQKAEKLEDSLNRIMQRIIPTSTR